MSKKFTSKRFQLRGSGRLIRCLFGSKGHRNMQEKVEVRPVLATAPVKKSKKTKKTKK